MSAISGKSIVGRSRPGGRSARVRSAVLTAAVDHLADRGWDDFSVDAIAAAAGVHRTTVYRRWPTREALFLAAAGEYAAAAIPTPDTGSLRGDLEALARGIAAELDTPVGKAWVQLAPRGALGDPTWNEIRRRFLHDRYERVRPILDRAVGRGEIPPETSSAEVFRTLCSPLYTRLLITGEPLDQAATTQAAAIVLAAIAERLLTQPPASSA
ncbi:MAG: hypothetical protein QG671_1527 [Actinomycetota bacterium]|nr:hypothetical protein [Actinomycetota bacterium]